MTSAVTDVYGNTLNSLTPPTNVAPFAGNLSDNSNIRIDTVARTSTIDGVEFDVENGAFIISGDLFGTIDRAADDDVVAQLDWSEVRMGY